MYLSPEDVSQRSSSVMPLVLLSYIDRNPSYCWIHGFIDWFLLVLIFQMKRGVRRDLVGQEPEFELVLVETVRK